MALFLVASTIIFLLQTRHGIGVLPDSVRYMRVAPTSYDAPLYTWMLDLVRMSGYDLVQGAKVIGLVLVCANTALIWHILTRGENPLVFSVLGTALIVLSPAFTIAHAVAMSEPVFFLLIFCSVLAFMAFFRTHNRLLLVPSAVAGGAATLARFSALPLSAAMGLALLANPRRTLRQRIADLICFALIEGVIFFGWIGASAASNGHGIGREVRLYGT